MSRTCSCRIERERKKERRKKTLRTFKVDCQERDEEKRREKGNGAWWWEEGTGAYIDATGEQLGRM
jgi:hypothetical protein